MVEDVLEPVEIFLVSSLLGFALPHIVAGTFFTFESICKFSRK